MKSYNSLIFIILLETLIVSCEKDNNDPASLKESKVDLETHKLETYSVAKNTDYLVVFESGLGDDHSVWTEKNIVKDVSKIADVLLYDRAGYGKSETGPAPRNIEKLEKELETVIAHFIGNRKVILVGHSLGGLIIRDYAIKNPDKTAAILFVDPTHELYNKPDQSLEDNLYNTFKSVYGANFGATKEVREIIEDLSYSSTLPGLPDVPVVILTSMKPDAKNNDSDKSNGGSRQIWFNAHEQMGSGLTDFKHTATEKSGHYIMRDEPNLIIDNIQLLISKL